MGPWIIVTRAGGVALARDGQSAQADFVCSLRRIHSLGTESASRIGLHPPDHLSSIPVMPIVRGAFAG
jgi:hypothetical protein